MVAFRRWSSCRHLISGCELFRLIRRFCSGTRNRKNNPEGKSILRNAYTSWYYKTNIQRIEAIGVERDLAGLPVFEAPADYFSSAATSDQQSTLNTLKSIASSIRRDESEGW